jgi:hypothetical protein
MEVQAGKATVLVGVERFPVLKPHIESRVAEKVIRFFCFERLLPLYAGNKSI